MQLSPRPLGHRSRGREEHALERLIRELLQLSLDVEQAAKDRDARAQLVIGLDQVGYHNGREAARNCCTYSRRAVLEDPGLTRLNAQSLGRRKEDVRRGL